MRDFCRSAVLFGCGFFMALSICLGGYIAWEEVRPTEPMQINLVLPVPPPINPNVITQFPELPELDYPDVVI